MIDSAQTEMAQGKGIALEQISSVNDNMSRSHYHEYFELYFLDSGSRHQQLNVCCSRRLSCIILTVTRMLRFRGL